ncbi:MAG TPA: hypothetical protein VF158_17160 [Longimicrobiales bacterium]
MALIISNPAQPTGGPISGELFDESLDTDRFAIALFRYDGGGWQPDQNNVAVAPIWAFGLIRQGSRYAAALVTHDFVPTNELPVLGPKVFAVTTVPANRINFSSQPGAGKVSGTVKDVTPLEGYVIRLFTWSPDAAWKVFGDPIPISAGGAWSIENVPASRQYAAVLLPKGADVLPADGTLPNAVNVLFSATVDVAFGEVPPKTGGRLTGGLVGYGSVAGLRAVALSLAGEDDKVVATAVADCRPNGLWEFPAVKGGDKYAVAIVAGDAVPVYTAVPVRGGDVIAVATQPAS